MKFDFKVKYNIFVLFAFLISLTGNAMNFTAVKADSIIMVNTAMDNTNPSDSLCSLREAIKNANSDLTLPSAIAQPVLVLIRLRFPETT